MRSGIVNPKGIARAIQEISRDELLIEHGALYPALQRLEAMGWISAAWGTSENNRRAPLLHVDKSWQKATRARVDALAAHGCGHRSCART
jgi:PadR family transcriptional regulator PadR